MKKTDDEQCDEIAKHALFLVNQYEKKYLADGFGPEHFCMAALAAMSGIIRSGALDESFDKCFRGLTYRSLDRAYDESLKKRNYDQN